MDSILVLVATCLVVRKYVESKKNNTDTQFKVTGSVASNNTGPGIEEEQRHEEFGNVHALFNEHPGTMSVPGISEAPIRKSTNNGDDGGMQGFHEQFFPQDTRATGYSVTQKPWMRSVQDGDDTPLRTEKELAFPTESDREDIHQTRFISKVRNIQNLQTQKTIPRSKEKHFEYPVEAISTQNEGGGGLRGQRQLQRFHKFILNDDPRLEMKGGSGGMFTAAKRSGLSTENKVDNSRDELLISHTGVPVSASFKVGKPEQTFQVDDSNAESWLIDGHETGSGSRAPVQQSSTLEPSFIVAHDDFVEAFLVAQDTNRRPSRFVEAVSVENTETQLKDPALDTQIILGTPGGGRLQATNNTSSSRQFKPKANESAISKLQTILGAPGGTNLQATNIGSQQFDPKSKKESNVQTILGTPGGSRLQPTDTSRSRTFKPKSKQPHRIDVMSSSSSKSSGPDKTISRQTYLDADEKLVEEDTSERVRGANFRKKNDVREKSIRFNESKIDINAQREFTSKNFAAPQNRSLPAHLRIAPTSSITATTDMTLKDATVDTLAQNSMTRGVFAQNLAETKNRAALGSVGESTAKQRRMRLTQLNRQTTPGELTLLANPYMKNQTNVLPYK